MYLINLKKLLFSLMLLLLGSRTQTKKLKVYFITLFTSAMFSVHQYRVEILAQEIWLHQVTQLVAF